MKCKKVKKKLIFQKSYILVEDKFHCTTNHNSLTDVSSHWIISTIPYQPLIPSQFISVFFKVFFVANFLNFFFLLLLLLSTRELTTLLNWFFRKISSMHKTTVNNPPNLKVCFFLLVKFMGDFFFNFFFISKQSQNQYPFN